MFYSKKQIGKPIEVFGFYESLSIEFDTELSARDICRNENKVIPLMISTTDVLDKQTLPPVDWDKFNTAALRGRICGHRVWGSATLFGLYILAFYAVA